MLTFSQFLEDIKNQPGYFFHLVIINLIGLIGGPMKIFMGAGVKSSRWNTFLMKVTLVCPDYILQSLSQF
jgi:hypothetical protein